MTSFLQLQLLQPNFYITFTYKIYNLIFFLPVSFALLLCVQFASCPCYLNP